MDAIHDKIDRLMKRYEDQTAPIESRHALDLIADIAVVIKDLEKRIANAEGRLNSMNRPM